MMRIWGSGLFLLCLWCGALFLALSKGGFSSWFVMYCFSAAMLYSIVVVLFSLRKAEVFSEISKNRMMRGEELLVSVTVQQRSWIPAAWMIVEDRWTDQSGVSAGSHRKLLFPGFHSVMTYQYVIRGLNRGSYTFEEVNITAGDLFGFAVKRLKRRCERSFIVYPRMLDVGRELNPSGRSEGRKQTIQARAFLHSQMSSIRDYSQGDPLKQIHWKSTAKLGELKVKRADPENREDMFVILDDVAFSSSDHSRWRLSFETCVEVAAGLLQFAVRNKTGFGFMQLGAHASVLPYSLHTTRPEPGLELLAAVIPGNRLNRRWQLPPELMLLPKQVTIVWVVQHVDEIVMEHIRVLREYGRSVQVVWVRSDGIGTMSVQEQEAGSRLESMGCRYSIVCSKPYEDRLKAGVEDVGA